MDKELVSLNIHNKSLSNDPKKRIKAPGNLETSLIGYTNPQEGDNPYIKKKFSPEKLTSGSSKAYNRKANKHGKGYYVHTDGEKDQRNQGLRNVVSYPASLKEKPTNDDDDDDDDKEFGVINLSQITPSPSKNKKPVITGKIEGLLEISDDEDGDTKRTKKRRRNNASTISLEPINLLNSFEEAKYGSRRDILRRYKSKRIPAPITTRSELLKRARVHFKDLGHIIAGEKSPSEYYVKAKELQRNSAHETMTAKEQTKVDWEQFYGGYYGFQRQSIIGNEITKVCKNDLQKHRKNPTMSYWSIPSFATHVLANEVIIRMIMEDLNLDFEAAEKFCQESTDYGIVIADKVDIEDDV
ncbi:hypothetical protein CORT_0E05520 [Candida orthopsilosis Co 90-125]|uniref:Restriction of telomere capping protein 4 n=1 Tax=Candida orthopsilosis (strain 90-125) TaxID=1136231 RepID=H8X838_CANO9|nr:hypothetical protein CORT_0E05520 [Candida orthopsilosis Co 90-125]CCG24137.1 hypothetical protein CORT_0E05520 [Candida orthopsilosis Co 90-125]